MKAAAPLLLIAALAACDGKNKETTVASAKPAPKNGLLIGDVHLPTKTLLTVGTVGESALRVTAASDNVSCDDVASAYPDRPGGVSGVRVDFWLMQPLETDGTRGPWSFRSAYITDKDGGRGLITRGAQLDDLLEVGDSCSIKGLEFACQDRRDMIQWQGPLEAKNCGRIRRIEEPRPQADFKLTIAGQEFAVNGASVRPQAGQFFLRLTRAPHVCSSVFTEGYDFYLDIALKGDPPKVQFGALLGDIFPGDPSGSKGKETLKLEADGPLTGDTNIEISIDGTLDIGGFATTMKGKLDALRCTPL